MRIYLSWLYWQYCTEVFFIENFFSIDSNFTDHILITFIDRESNNELMITRILFNENICNLSIDVTVCFVNLFNNTLIDFKVLFLITSSFIHKAKNPIFFCLNEVANFFCR